MEATPPLTPSISEDGGTAIYGVKLASKPTANVSVGITSSSVTNATVNTPLNFTTSTWNTTQLMTVTGIANSSTSDETSTVSFTVTGGDYASFAVANITVTVTNNDSLFSRNSFAETTLSSLPFGGPREIQGLALWLDAEQHKTSLERGWPSLSDILVAQEGRESGELFAVTGQDGEVDLLSLLYPSSVSAKESSHDFGELKEVVIYEGPLEEAERAKLQRYLSCRWQLPVASGECL